MKKIIDFLKRHVLFDYYKDNLGGRKRIDIWLKINLINNEYSIFIRLNRGRYK